MPSLVAARFNPDMKAQHTHLVETGKPAKVALTGDGGDAGNAGQHGEAIGEARVGFDDLEDRRFEQWRSGD